MPPTPSPRQVRRVPLRHLPGRLGDVLRDAGISVAATLGDPDRTITGVAPLDWAGEGHITFCTTPGDAGAQRVAGLAASAVMCLPDVARSSPDTGLSNAPTRVAVANPRLAFAELCAAVYEPAPRAEIHPSAVIDPNASIGVDVSIGAGCVIGRCNIGDRVELRANVVVGDDVIIGPGTRVFAGTVIGSDGFAYERDEDGAMIKLAHLGGVVIGADVEIGSNTSIDRGTLSDTVIGDRCKIDNLVHVAHNVRIDVDAVVIAHAMLGGSVHIGARAWIAPGSQILQGLTVGADTTVGLGTVVLRNVEDGDTVVGVPAKVLRRAEP